MFLDINCGSSPEVCSGQNLRIHGSKANGHLIFINLIFVKFK